MDITGVLGILAGLAVGAAVLLATYVLWRAGSKKQQDYLLAALLLAIALRIGKSIWYFILYGAAPFGVGIGFLGLASTGPLLWLYSLSMRSNDPINWIRSSAHFLLPLGGLILIWQFIPDYATLLYKFATAMMLVYIIVSWRNFSSSENPNKNWSSTLLISVCGVWAVFVFQHLTDTMLQYAIGAGLAVIPLHYLLFRAVQENGRLHPSASENELSDTQLRVVQKALEDDALYRTKGLSLKQFADAIGVPSYLVTRAVQQLYDRSFPETINYFRIKEVQAHLLNPENLRYKIESLAYEVGFSSPSTFYSAFKKETQLSPKQFRAQQSQLN